MHIIKGCVALTRNAAKKTYISVAEIEDEPADYFAELLDCGVVTTPTLAVLWV